MDPETCLDEAEWQIMRDPDEAAHVLECYAQWRRNGGFAPVGGDERAARLQFRLHAVVR